MQSLLALLRASAEPTRLRLLALIAGGPFCVTELTEILGQSQPRLSRHLRLLCDCGLLARTREGANVWFALAEGPNAALARDILARLPADDAELAGDRRRAARVLAERARAASEKFRRQGIEWDETGALDLPVAALEQALLAALPAGDLGHLLDIGTGTGRLLEILAPRITAGLGIDASAAMLALARARLARARITHCRVRRADLYRLPLGDGGFDLVVMQMVLHYAEDPRAALAEAARMLRPGGRFLLIDLAAHHRADLLTRLAHRWPGFSETAIADMLHAAGLALATAQSLDLALTVRLWTARPMAAARAEPAFAV
jgi:ArsR family transcriptional regulator